MKNLIKNNKILFVLVATGALSGFVLWTTNSHAQFGAFGAVSAPFALQMDEGNSGPEVTKLQTFLAGNSSIYPEGLITGYFGPLTKAAVVRFQTAYGIGIIRIFGTQNRLSAFVLSSSFNN